MGNMQYNTDLTMGLIKADIIAANQAISYYKENNVKNCKNIAAYHIQQAVEKLIKIQIYRSGVTYSNHKVFTHDLIFLHKYACSLNICYSIPKGILKDLKNITDWEAGSRYSVRFSVRIDKLENTYKQVLYWYNQLYKFGIR